jgi:hypothetical protein
MYKRGLGSIEIKRIDGVRMYMPVEPKIAMLCYVLLTIALCWLWKPWRRLSRHRLLPMRRVPLMPLEFYDNMQAVQLFGWKTRSSRNRFVKLDEFTQPTNVVKVSSGILYVPVGGMVVLFEDNRIIDTVFHGFYRLNGYKVNRIDFYPVRRTIPSRRSR